MKKRPLPAALRRSLYLRRRPLAAVCAFLAVLASLLALSPDRGSTTTVYAARAALPAGTVLAADHLVPLSLPLDVVPEGAAEVESEVVGRTLAAPVSARTIMTEATVSEGERLARPGHVVVSLPLGSDGIADLVRPGVRIDVLDPAGEVVAADVRVIAPPDIGAGQGGLGLGSGTRSALVEVPSGVAASLASHGGSPLTVVVR